jgi:hypothetical protein
VYAPTRSAGVCTRISADEDAEANDDGDKESIGNALLGSESEREWEFEREDRENAGSRERAKRSC